MKIYDLLDLKSLAGAKFITGNIGMHYEVESAMVLEASDIEKWGKRNQIILTSYFGLTHLAYEELVVFFKKLKNIGISGIILKINRLIDHTPSNLIKLCIEYEIPLIEISNTFSYEKIIIEIFEPLLNKRSRLLRTYYETSKEISLLRYRKVNFEEILAIFHKIISESCRITFLTDNRSYQIGKEFDYIFDIESKKRLESEYTSNSYIEFTMLDTASNLTYYQYVINTSKFNRWLIKIDVISSKQLDYDWLIMVTENFIELLIQQLQMRDILKKERFSLLNNIAGSILFNTSSTPSELEDLLDETNLNKHPYYQIVGIIKENHSVNTDKIRNKISNLRNHFIYYENRKFTLILFNIEDTQAITKNELKALNEGKHQIVISSLKNRLSINHAFNECMTLSKLIKNYQFDNILEMSMFGTFIYFLSNDTLLKTDPIYLKILNFKNDHPELYSTFVTFIAKNKNYIDTANSLFIHAKTVRYRLNKIQKLLAFDLCNPTEYMTISTYALLIEFLERSTLNE